jgi:hypothetical protein
MEKFKSGFTKGDTIVQDACVSGNRYVIVSNRNKRYVVADNGERREQHIIKGEVKFNPPLNKPSLTGDLSLSTIKGKHNG